MGHLRWKLNEKTFEARHTNSETYSTVHFMQTSQNITFKRLDKQEYGEFRNDVKNIFSIAVIESFGELDDKEAIVPDSDINMSLYDPQCETLAVYADGKKVGGVTVRINHITQHNWLDLFYLYPDQHGKGLGLQIWQSLEKRYPETKVWRLITPYFEKRNIHFYVNKCSFKIVEFFNKAHREPGRGTGCHDFHDEYFIFEKIME